MEGTPGILVLIHAGDEAAVRDGAPERCGRREKMEGYGCATRQYDYPSAVSLRRPIP
jgi:hypothetical protein